MIQVSDSTKMPNLGIQTDQQSKPETKVEPMEVKTKSPILSPDATGELIAANPPKPPENEDVKKQFRRKLRAKNNRINRNALPIKSQTAAQQIYKLSL